jgi:hypothetical protein
MILVLDMLAEIYARAGTGKAIALYERAWL